MNNENNSSGQVPQIFKNPDFGAIRTNGTSEQPLFCATDVCAALGYANGRDAVAKHCDEGDVAKCDTLTQGGTQSLTYVNESGLYALIFGSKLESARKFKRWVTSEVLPEIRKHKSYIAPNIADDDAAILHAMQVLQRRVDEKDAQLKEANTHIAIVEERNEQQERQLTEQAPKVLFADSVAASQNSVLVSDLAKVLSQNGYETGEKRLFEELRSRGFLCVRDGYKNQPAQRYLEMGLFEIKYGNHQNPNGTSFVTKTTKVTAKGLVYFVNYFLNIKKSA